MIVVVDTSALGKLLVQEDESVALTEFFSQRSVAGDQFLISSIAVTELRRLAIRTDLDPARIEPIVRRFRTMRLTEAMVKLAGRLPEQHLGTLDAIHIATALSVDAEALASYDVRQCEAAKQEGLIVISPGR